MDFVAVRDFRIRPGRVWSRLRRTKRLLVTSNGKPIAFLSDVREREVEDQLRIESMVRGVLALEKARGESLRSKRARLSMKDIVREIGKTRIRHERPQSGH